MLQQNVVFLWNCATVERTPASGHSASRRMRGGWAPECSVKHKMVVTSKSKNVITPEQGDVTLTSVSRSVAQQKSCTFGNRLRESRKNGAAKNNKRRHFQEEWSVEQRNTLRPPRSRAKKASKSSLILRFPDLLFLNWLRARPLVSRRCALIKCFQQDVETIRETTQQKKQNGRLL